MGLIIGMIAILLIFRPTIVTVLKVKDGDSIIIRQRRLLRRGHHAIECRIAGYDAPEWDQAQGPGAAAELRRQVLGLRFLMTGHKIDVYGRKVVRLYGMKGPIATRMILAGQGFPASGWGIPAMIFARLFRRGMWAMGPVVHPSVWRKLKS